MPLLLSPEQEDIWLHPIENESERLELQDLICKKPIIELEAHTVRKLRGKEYIGNVEEISDEYIYPELKAG